MLCLWILLLCQCKVNVPETSLLFVCVYKRESVSLCVYLRTGSNLKYGPHLHARGGGCKSFPFLYRNAHTLIHYQALMMLFFSLWVRLWHKVIYLTSQQPKKVTWLLLSPTVYCKHRQILYTHMHRGTNNSLFPKSDSPSDTLKHTHTHTHLHGGAWQRAIDCLYLAWQTIHNFSPRET